MMDDDIDAQPWPIASDATPPRDAGANDEALRLRILALTQEHADLDAAIAAMEGGPAPVSTLAVQRLKKRKLAIKDRIAALKDQLRPDITA